MRFLACAIVITVLAGCEHDTRITQPDPAMGQGTALADRTTPNNEILFPHDAHPYGASMVTWSERLSQWYYAAPAAVNPLLDQTGADCAVDQHGPVWFIPYMVGPLVFSGSRTCTIPHDKALLLDIGNFVNDYPCPDPGFQPAPGQSLYDFLIAGATAFMDGVNRLDVSLDGHPLHDVLSYRFASSDVFYLKGDPSNTTALDGCITGSLQPAVSDGFFMMFKPLSPGEHTIRVFGTDVRGANKTYVFHLTIQ